MAILQACLDKLAKFDTPTICNVIELFDVRPRNRGYMDARIRSNFPDFAPVVGFAATAQFRSDSPAEGGDAYGSIQAQLEQFQQLPGPRWSCFRMLMTRQLPQSLVKLCARRTRRLAPPD